MRVLEEYERLRIMTHVSPVGLFRVDAHGLFTYLNERFCELTGVTASEGLGANWAVGLHPDDVEHIRGQWEESITHGRQFRSEYRYVRPDGKVVWVLGQVARELGGRGEVVGYVGSLTEITELRHRRDELEQAQADLKESAHSRAEQLRRMELIVQASDDAIISADLSGQIVSWNGGAERLFGYRAEEMMGSTGEILTPAESLNESEVLRARVKAGEEIHHYETVRMAKNGQLIEVSLSIFPLRDDSGTIIGTSAIVRDITARNRAERQLRRLSARLLRLQDEERRRIARELHDSTAQTLAALCMSLSALVQGDAQLPPARRTKLLSDCLTLADSATKELRSTAYLLHPPLLDERGLPSAMRWLVEGIEGRSEVKVALEMDESIHRLPSEAEVALFRVVQESLMNVIRHSGSQTAVIRLYRDGQFITLEVRDFGRGFAVPQEEVLGVGVAGMKERLFELGGELTIQPNNPGTAVIARLPQEL